MKYLSASEISKIRDICRKVDVRWDESENGDYTIWKAIEAVSDRIDKLESKIKKLESKV